MTRLLPVGRYLIVLLPLLPMVAVIEISQSCYHAFIQGTAARVSPLERHVVPWAQSGCAPIQFRNIPFQDFSPPKPTKPAQKRDVAKTTPEHVVPRESLDRATAVRSLRLAGFAGRTLWSTTTSLYLITQLAVFVTGSCLVFGAADGTRRARWGWLLAVLAVTGAVTAGVANSVRNSYATTEQFLEKTVAVDWGRDGPADVPHLANLRRAITAVDLSGAAAILFLSLAIGVTLLPTPVPAPEANAPEPPAETTEETPPPAAAPAAPTDIPDAVSPAAMDTEAQALSLARQMERQRQILYVGTVLLVVALLQANFLYRWALAFVYPAEGLVHKALETLIVNIVVARGILDSLLLAALYLPAALLLKARAAALVPPVVTDSDSTPTMSRPRRFPETQEWLKDYGLASDPQELIPRVAAILGPLLAGSAAQMLDVLKPAG